MFKYATLLAALLQPQALTAAEPSAADTTELENVTVTATRRPAPQQEQAGNITRLSADAIADTAPTHPAELFTRVPGALVSRGSGQEHLTAIRSPVLTGPGACGAFLFAEDGIPIRPAGFCNVNQLFELNLEQADAVEVIRGPASALYGSNAQHGLINVVHLPPAKAGPGRASLEAGGDDYARLLFDSGKGLIRLRFNAAHDNDYREAAGYTQQKLNLDLQPGGDLRVTFAATNLDQDTAGFIPGFEAYRDPALREANFNPEAYRKADSQRLAAHWEPAGPLALRAYLRRSRMEFLQHYLPEQSREENGQQSGGLLFSYDWGAAGAPLITGFDLEYADGFLREIQDEPLTEGSPFLQETRPAGPHYDYTVRALLAAPYLHLETPLAADWRLEAGLRAEYLRYGYDNHLPAGNTRLDGTACGFGGCLFNRPADRSDAFLTLAPKLGLGYALSDTRRLWFRLARGFRVPQATELYRLQRGQDVADLEPETVASAELGWRAEWPGLRLETTLFFMDKRHLIFRDAAGFNVSDGRSLHRGLELALEAELGAGLSLGLNGSYAIQRYAFDRDAARGEAIRSGNELDTAPRRLGGARLAWRYAPGGRLELEWVHLGGYFLDAANEHRYPGHDLFHLRIRQALTEDWRLGLRLMNLTDRAYAERADYAFGAYRYFPGRPRAAYLEISRAL